MSFSNVWVPTAFFLATIFSSNLEAQTPSAPTRLPTVAVVQNEIANPSYFSFLLGGIAAKGERRYTSTKSENGQIYEWSNDKETVVAQFGRSAADDSAVSRLSEMKSAFNPKKKTSELVGVTTTFYKNGVRSKTRCSADTGETASCVTASRKFCAEFRAKSKASELPPDVVASDEGISEYVLRRGRECSEFADYLDKTLDPMKLLNGTERADRDSGVVSADLEALSELKKSTKAKPINAFSLKGLDDWFDADDKVGASTTGMANRKDRLKQARTDFMALSHLAAMCAETNFVEQKPGTGWTISPETQSRKTRP